MHSAKGKQGKNRLNSAMVELERFTIQSRYEVDGVPRGIAERVKLSQLPPENDRGRACVGQSASLCGCIAVGLCSTCSMPACLRHAVLVGKAVSAGPSQQRIGAGH